VAGRVTCGDGGHGELEHEQGLLVAKHLLVVCLGTEHRAQYHTVADEVEDVLGFLGSRSSNDYEQEKEKRDETILHIYVLKGKFSLCKYTNKRARNIKFT
jgi:hypothetical protein